jgi:3-phosphoshikimate 1-carboxyvinyltransferase
MALSGTEELIYSCRNCNAILLLILQFRGYEVVTLTGSSRMQERQNFSRSFRTTWAQISIKDGGILPFKLRVKITNSKVTMAANVSSQYISALLLVAPKLRKRHRVNTRRRNNLCPYIKMMALLNDLEFKPVL